MISVEEISVIIGLPVDDWHGKCYGVACGLLKHKIVEGHPIYGHYVGPIDIDGYWGSHIGLPFVRHGWVMQNDGTIIDPTRWSFENKSPYVAIITNNDDRHDEYDDSGSMIRIMMRQPCPETNESKKVNLNLYGPAKELVDTLFGDKATSDYATQSQIMWLANAPYGQLGDFVPHIYEAIKNYSEVCYIPVDHLQRAIREFQVDL